MNAHVPVFLFNLLLVCCKIQLLNLEEQWEIFLPLQRTLSYLRARSAGQ